MLFATEALIRMNHSWKSPSRFCIARHFIGFLKENLQTKTGKVFKHGKHNITTIIFQFSSH